MKFLRTINKILSSFEQGLVVFLLTLMVILAFLQVFMRNVFSSGFVWGDPLLRHMVLWIGFLGASLATHQEKHINLDIAGRYVSPKTSNLIRIFTNLFASIITYSLAAAGMTFLGNEKDTDDILVTIGQFPLQAWWFEIIIPAGFGLMAFRFLIRTIEHIICFINPSMLENLKEETRK